MATFATASQRKERARSSTSASAPGFRRAGEMSSRLNSAREQSSTGGGALGAALFQAVVFVGAKQRAEGGARLEERTAAKADVRGAAWGACHVSEGSFLGIRSSPLRIELCCGPNNPLHRLDTEWL